MRDFNEVKLMGKVATDLQHRTTPWGSSEYHCRLAVDNGYKNLKTNEWVDRTSFINVKLVLKNSPSPVDAAIIEKIQKGSKLFVSGKINQREYPKNGETQIWTEVEARQFELMEIHKFENATDQGQLEQQRRDSSNQLPSLKASTGIQQPSIKDVLDTSKSSDEIANQVAGYMSNELPKAPEGGAGDLDDEIPF